MIKLDEEFKIVKETHGVTLIRETEIQAIDKETRKPIEGKTSISRESFYLGNVEQCLKTYLKIKISDVNGDVKDVLTAIETVNENITKAFKNTRL